MAPPGGQPWGAARVSFENQATGEAGEGCSQRCLLPSRAGQVSSGSWARGGGGAEEQQGVGCPWESGGGGLGRGEKSTVESKTGAPTRQGDLTGRRMGGWGWGVGFPSLGRFASFLVFREFILFF